MWAAVLRELEGKGGVYVEDVSVSQPREPKNLMTGYAPHAYDTEGAKKLWAVSNQLVGLPEDQ